MENKEASVGLGRHLVAVVGGGPAGLYGAAKIAERGHSVVIFNRDLKPGGLAEYGIYPNKRKMKEGIRRQFRKILASPNVHYFGGVEVGENGALSLPELEEIGWSAVIVAAGAQGTKSLGLPGEESRGVCHAKDLVYHYNRLPPFSQRPFEIGQRVAVVGIGNVMVDVAHWLINEKKVGEVIAVARRGPAERAYVDREMEIIAANIYRPALREELERIRSRLEAVGQDVEALFKEVTKDCDKPAKDGPSPTRLLFRFLSAPKRILADSSGRVRALEVEETELIKKGDSLSARGLGNTYQIPCDTVIFAVGDRVDANLGLPYRDGIFLTNPNPRPDDPDANLYEVYDPESGKAIPGMYVFGWSRKASDGLVGKAKQDGERGALLVLRYLESLPPLSQQELENRLAAVRRLLVSKGVPFVDKDAWQLLEAREKEEAERRKLEEFKYADNREMLAAIEEMRSRVAIPNGQTNPQPTT